MASYQITESDFNRLTETSFNAAKIDGRKDLQRLFNSNVEALSPGLKVSAEASGGWDEQSL